MARENQKVLYEHFLQLAETGTKDQKEMANREAKVIDDIYNFSGEKKPVENILDKIAEQKNSKTKKAKK